MLRKAAPCPNRGRGGEGGGRKGGRKLRFHKDEKKQKTQQRRGKSLIREKKNGVNDKAKTCDIKERRNVRQWRAFRHGSHPPLKFSPTAGAERWANCSWVSPSCPFTSGHRSWSAVRRHGNAAHRGHTNSLWEGWIMWSRALQQLLCTSELVGQLSYHPTPPDLNPARLTSS